MEIYLSLLSLILYASALYNLIVNKSKYEKQNVVLIVIFFVFYILFAVSSHKSYEPPEDTRRPKFIFYGTDYFEWKCTEYNKIIKREPVQSNNGMFSQSTEFDKVCAQWTLKEKIII